MSAPEHHSQSSRKLHQAIVIVLLIIMALPILATLGYALAREWSLTLLPTGFTLDWFIELWSNPRFLEAMRHSLFVCLCSVLLTVSLVLPTVFVVYYRFPQLKGTMNMLTILPFVCPPIVSAVGLMQIFSESPVTVLGTPWVLIGCYFTVILPFVYRAISNNIEVLNLQDLMDAASLHGAPAWRALLLIIVPGIRKGIIIAMLFSLSLLMSEFVFANLLAGNQYETIQVFLFSLRNCTGHISSALVITYFLVILIITMVTHSLSRSRGANHVLP